ncbi:bifunctional metallophosphatase/5'-nucleotidase [Advenella sp. RU8]|uniref:bifunctional metallophosphatase/5'-nucleotidase n=1 Tax=Advenella sp. RU8 TaxID=3399575 RepID=UPI003AAE7D54
MMLNKSVIFSLGIFCSATVFAQTPAPVSEPDELTILHINDHHSNLEAYSANLLLNTGKQTQREPVSVSLGGFARISAAFESLAKNNDNVLKLHAGDATTGTLYHSLSVGQADADLMNTICFDAMTVGNHELDLGDLALFNFMEMLWYSPACKTPLLSSNLRPGPKSALANNVIKPSIVLERGGHKIGIVGVTSAYKTQHASRPDPGTILGNELESVQNEINRLTQQGVNRIIVLAHLGYPAEQKLAQQLSGVDIIVGGDSHTLLGSKTLNDYGLKPMGPYPTRLVNADNQPVCLVQAWQYSSVVGELKVRFDANDNVVDCQGQPHLLIGTDFNRKGTPVTPEEHQAILADLATQTEIMAIEPSARALSMLAPHQEKLKAFANQQVGTAPLDICSRRFPGVAGAGSSKLAGCDINQHPNTHGGDIQQLVAHAFLMQGKNFGGADIAIQNGGGVRTDIAAGPVTVGDIYSVLPFRNMLVRLTVKGQDLKKVLEDSIDSVLKGNTGSYPYAAGLRWDLDLAAPKQEKLSNLQTKQEDGTWGPLDPERTYKVIIIDFLADGKDGYQHFANAPDIAREDTFLPYAESFLKYVQSNPTLERLPVTEYSTQTIKGIASLNKLLGLLKK